MIIVVGASSSKVLSGLYGMWTITINYNTLRLYYCKTQNKVLNVCLLGNTMNLEESVVSHILSLSKAH
jgi:hypothetical protein